MQLRKFAVTRIVAAMLMATFSLVASAQDTALKGTVLDETGQPAIGASIQIEVEKGGTVSDVD